jgi:general secretion pathway protein D
MSPSTVPPRESTAPTPPSATGAQTPPLTAPAQIIVATPGPEFRIGGGPYTVPISVSGASRMSVVSLSLTFNPAIVRVRTVQEGTFLRQGGTNATFTQHTDPASGRVDISIARNGDATGASGTGLLGAVLFDAIAAGSTTFSISGVATAPDGTTIPLTFTPANVTVK